MAICYFEHLHTGQYITQTDLVLTLVAFVYRLLWSSVSSSCGVNVRRHFLLELSTFSLLSFFCIYFLLIYIQHASFYPFTTSNEHHPA